MDDYKIQTNAKGETHFSQILSNLNQNFKEQDIIQKANQKGMDYVNLIGFNINFDLANLVSLEDSQKGKIIPFFLIGKKLRLALVDPENEFAKQVVQQLKDSGYKINLNLCSEESLIEAQKIFSRANLKIKEEELLLDNQETRQFDVEIDNLSQYVDRLEEFKSDELLDLINLGALKTNSSDVHIQPEENSALLRFRIDGVLKNIFQMPLKVYESLVKQIKYEAHLKFNVLKLPQDGQFNFKVNNSKIDVRVSTLPTEFGETVVMRFLDPRKGIVTFEQLGFEGRNLNVLQKSISIPNGMIVVTGPTGSGKTTTLYSILNQINSTEKKIITLEDPIEYHLPGISQSQVDENAGYNFALGLRAILRQDPNIVMVGEIRDQETAETAAQAALTGHLVLSTLHTNSAVETIPRLINVGVKPFILAPALNVVIAQRLVRKLCQNCAMEKELSEAEYNYVRNALDSMKDRGVVVPAMPLKLKHSVGCEKCSKTGYLGQVALLEILNVSEKIKALILDEKSSAEILKQALQEGLITLKEDGLLKVVQGLTDLKEIERVV